MRAALTISGGGAKGSFAVGAIEVLLDHGYEFDVISGTSTGALIAPLVAIGDIAEAVRIYTTVRTKDIIRKNWRRFFIDAIYDTKPLERLIRRTMKGERYERLMASPTRVLLCLVGFRSGRVLYASQKQGHRAMSWGDFDGYVAATLASTNQPMLMPPSMFAGQACFDGGVREIAPLSVVMSEQNKVVVIANSPADPALSHDLHYSMLTIGPRAIDLMTTEILNNDLVQNSDADVTVIRPLEPLPCSDLEFVPEDMKRAREIGQQRAREVLGS